MSMMEEQQPPLTPEQIEVYLRDGILVVDDLLSHAEIIEARDGLTSTLWKEYGVDVGNLEKTGRNLVDASSTNGAGGVLDIFYPEWKMKIATNEMLFRVTCQLWKEAYCYSGERVEDLIDKSGASDGADIEHYHDDVPFKWHPFRAFDCSRGFMYVDRIGFRIPTKLAESIGEQVLSTTSDSKVTFSNKKAKRPRPIQRSLTPHFDCCPETYHDTTKQKSKWRPIQCFVSLTDNLQSNTGGFEAVPGFHREFRSWVERGRRSMRDFSNEASLHSRPRPCVGEYSHLDPTFDRDIIERIKHIPVRAGSAVFWDDKIPHGNSYRNDLTHINGDTAAVPDFADTLEISGARAVVYCSFLPDVDVNRNFVLRQLDDWKLQRPPRAGDRWIRYNDNPEGGSGDFAPVYIGTARGESDIIETRTLTELGKRLLGLVDWS